LTGGIEEKHKKTVRITSLLAEMWSWDFWNEAGVQSTQIMPFSIALIHKNCQQETKMFLKYKDLKFTENGFF
jgi:hypothetical protein